MEDHKPTSFSFEIDNFLQKEAAISSPTFSSGGCQWYAMVYPKGNGIEDHLALYLYVANSGSFQLGWKRRAKYSFVLLNQSGKEIHKTAEMGRQVFCAQVPGWGNPKVLTLKNLQEKGFLETNSKLIVKVQVQVLEVFNEAEVTGNETMDVKGFQVLYSQAIKVSWIFLKHPGIALNFKPKSQLVKTTYMNLLLKLIEKLDKPPHSFSETELSNTCTELADLTETGFKLDWLKEKLDEISLERKKIDDASRIQELEQQNKNLKAELNEEKFKSATFAAKVLWLEHTDHKPTSFMFEIDNFLEKEDEISSPTFSSGGCQWYASVYPKGNGIDDHLALYLRVSNLGSLQLGWERRAKFSFALLNQSGKEFYKTTEVCQVFCAQVQGCGYPKALILKKLQEKGFLETNSKLIVKVQVLEVVNEAEVTGNETMDVKGFQVLYSQAIQVSMIFVRHPDTALNFKPKSQLVKTTYMNLLLKLIEKLDKPPHSFTECELSNIRTELVDLTETGFKLDWLEEKLDEISLEKFKAELNKEKIKSATSAAKVLLLEQKVSTLNRKLNKKPKLSPN
ncbi:unnamed protein product [Eruca vesicaria subsp. sativa]|uniref:MATH domain-containing protein n=1 Tax=Eruca vesicaria subsp. sativa TaxID=29727 RepID=A0ABC8IRP3_ERUVS|nr:unnamed protein product [Eruca vesicaria subsp. sativa]